MTEPINEIIQDVRMLFDTRIKEDKAHNELWTVLNSNPNSKNVKFGKDRLNETENESYEDFLEWLETDFDRIFYIIEFETQKPLDRSLDDAGLVKGIEKRIEFVSLREEVQSIKRKIMKNVRKYRRRYNDEYSGKPYLTIRETFDERLKYDRFLRGLYEGTVFNHVDYVLGKYDLTENLDYAKCMIYQFEYQPRE